MTQTNASTLADEDIWQPEVQPKHGNTSRVRVMVMARILDFHENIQNFDRYIFQVQVIRIHP